MILLLWALVEWHLIGHPGCHAKLSFAGSLMTISFHLLRKKHLFLHAEHGMLLIYINVKC